MADPWDDYLLELETRDDPDRRRLRFKGRRRILGGGGGLGVTSVLAAGQNTPVNAGPINFNITFSAPVTGFTSADVNFGGSTVGGTLLATVTGTGPSYNVAVSGMTGNGTVMVNIPAGAANAVTGGAPNPQSMAAFVTFDTTQPSVTIAAAAGQPDPAGVSPITYTVVFNEAVTGFLASDVVITGTAGGTKTAILTGGPATYNVQISGMTTAGTVIANVPANAAQDFAGNLSLAAAAPATVNWAPDVTAPTVTIDRAAGQADPANSSPIVFAVVFSETVTGFVSADVSTTGSTTGGTLVATVAGSGTTYTISVAGMAAPDGNVVVNFAAGAASDLAGNASAAPTILNNTVGWTSGAITPSTAQTYFFIAGQY